VEWERGMFGVDQSAGLIGVVDHDARRNAALGVAIPALQADVSHYRMRGTRQVQDGIGANRMELRRAVAIAGEDDVWTHLQRRGDIVLALWDVHDDVGCARLRERSRNVAAAHLDDPGSTPVGCRRQGRRGA